MFPLVESHSQESLSVSTLKPPSVGRTSEPSALARREPVSQENLSTTKDQSSIESSLTSWLKGETSLKETELEENLFMELSSLTRTSRSSTPSHISSQWLMLARTPMEANSSSLLSPTTNLTESIQSSEKSSKGLRLLTLCMLWALQLELPQRLSKPRKV